MAGGELLVPPTALAWDPECARVKAVGLLPERWEVWGSRRKQVSLRLYPAGASCGRGLAGRAPGTGELSRCVSQSTGFRASSVAQGRAPGCTPRGLRGLTACLEPAGHSKACPKVGCGAGPPSLRLLAAGTSSAAFHHLAPPVGGPGQTSGRQPDADVCHQLCLGPWPCSLPGVHTQALPPEHTHFPISGSPLLPFCPRQAGSSERAPL